MTLPINFRRVARAEYRQAVEWYDSRKRGLGATFEAVLNTVSNQPDRYPLADEDVREAPVTGFPFSVLYRVRTHWVVVIAVFHHSRDPAEWQSRS